MKSRIERLSTYPAPFRIGVFVLMLLLIWAPFVGLTNWLVHDSNTASIVTILLLYAEFIFLVRLWGRYVYHQPDLLKRYGLVKTRRNGINFLTGLAIGLISLLLMFAVQGVLGWVTWLSPQPFLPRIILEGSLTGLGIGFAEELLFRGWLLDELQRDYSLQRAMWINAIVFALLHAPRSIAQVPALILLGLALVLAKRASGGRLGLSIGLHGGLVWGYYMVNVGQLTKYSNQVPDWLTGIGGNPLASLTGMVALGAIALGMKIASSRPTDPKT
ncbi:CPBP family intramembrane metalloprotease [Phormidesmis priestleyi ULC007]|uniref:CPBP family intramembrane metalloprotease n=1 Tax=Phormidesmis priestleyi ULC007 TaxID=1920490 RepID=A0A2T1DNZ6_9CYAN|nr:type II CAAX endopeptidase family protein [Phormidesmis priestleyi]PSB22217.1 CPBP family intramembrane metalloprotease [Phormidesmis priestleyi ULC007]PZO52522.1 MAG: CPBP family intramembrane metalloprotease [Phormidesmis priestleyi]